MMLVMRNNNYKFSSLFLLLSAALSSSTMLSSCGFNSESIKLNETENIAWLESGTLSVGGPVSQNNTAIQISDSNDYLSQSYGFSISGPRSLVIEPSKNRASLYVAGREVSKAQLLESEGFDASKLPAGTYTIAHKQRNPLWYAPDEYFSARGLKVPDQGDKMRFLRGAYGDFALFLDADKAIHSGPFDLQEISGIRCEEKEMSKIFYSMEVGDRVQIIMP